ncbi:MAG: DUF177 domain-containing protein [Clostridia bacterium]|nr:DUF177 domain-containing protein [Clostridia bacterium]
MILDLRHVFSRDNSRLEFDGTVDMSAVDVSGGFPLKKPVRYGGVVFNESSVVILNIRIEYEFTAPCDRCGKISSGSHTVTIDKSLATSLERQESDTIIVVSDMQLEVDELVYSEVILDLPSKHLCKEDCKGLCQKCGKNLNDGDCGCDLFEPDPRFEKLRELLND